MDLQSLFVVRQTFTADGRVVEFQVPLWLIWFGGLLVLVLLFFVFVRK